MILRLVTVARFVWVHFTWRRAGCICVAGNTQVCVCFGVMLCSLCGCALPSCSRGLVLLRLVISWYFCAPFGHLGDNLLDRPSNLQSSFPPHHHPPSTRLGYAEELKVRYTTKMGDARVMARSALQVKSFAPTLLSPGPRPILSLHPPFS